MSLSSETPRLRSILRKVDREPALRAHIRSQLLNYALTHLTVDYVAYTNEITADTLEASLYPVPTNDPTSLALEPPLRDQINVYLKLQKYAHFEEKWATSTQAVAFLREAMSGQTGSTRTSPTKHCWDEIDDSDKFSILPASPILTASSMRQTPQLGTTQKTGASKSLNILLEQHDLLPVDSVDFLEPPPLRLNDALGNRLQLDAAGHAQVLELVKPIAMLCRPNESSNSANNNPHLEIFLRANSPSYRPPTPLSPTLFSRDSKPGGSEPFLGGDLKDILDFVGKVDTDEDMNDEYRYEQDMQIVDGWQTFHIPVSPVSSTGSDYATEVDELAADRFLPSPSTSATYVNLSELMMEEYQFPRSSKLGESKHQWKHIGESEELSKFLSFLKPIPCTPSPLRGKYAGAHTLELSSPRSPVTASTSMLGQPPTEMLDEDSSPLGEDHETPLQAQDTAPTNDFDLNAVLNIFRHDLEALNTDSFDLSTYILSDKLDEVDSLLMDVPDLPPAYEQNNAMKNLPNRLSDLIMRDDGNKQTEHRLNTDVTDRAQHQLEGQHLKKIKGLPSLNMELSWRPFNWGHSIPTHEELARVVDNIESDCLADLIDHSALEYSDPRQALARLVELARPEDKNNSPAAVSPWFDCDQPPHQSSTCLAQDDHTFILTAQERRRLNGYRPPVNCNDDEPYAKRTKVMDDLSRSRTQGHNIQISDKNKDPYCQPAVFQDSGVPINPHSSPGSTTSFGSLEADDIGFCDGDEINALTQMDMIHLQGLSTPEYLYGMPWQPPAGATQPALFMAMKSTELAGHEDLDEPASRKSAASVASCLDYSLQPGLMTTHGQDSDLSAAPGHQDTGANNSPLVSTSAATRISLQTFIKLRTGSSVLFQDLVPTASAMISEEVAKISTPFPDRSSAIPLDLVDQTLFSLPEALPPVTCDHRYLASIEFIQRRLLVRAMASPERKIRLIEREELNGADIIIDPDTAVIFSSLRSLPTQCESLLSRVIEISWRFTWLLVVFEISPDGGSDSSSGRLAVNPFSPPVIKAIRKFKRNLGISEACLDKRAETVVQFAFPLSTDETANIIRVYGDITQTRETSNDIVWDDRSWLDVDHEDLDERDLAAIDGMNVFAAAIVLRANGLDEFIDKPAEQRSYEFSHLIGQTRIDIFNKVIARRIEAMQLPSSSPPSASINTSVSLNQSDDYPGANAGAELYYNPQRYTQAV